MQYPNIRAEHCLKVTENRMLRRISASERDEIKGGWGRLDNEKLHNFSLY
jgi:hypothetical protein